MWQTSVSSLTILVGLASVVLGQTKESATQQHAMIGVAKSETLRSIREDPARRWFPEAGLGLFVHWGISSVSGQHDLSWGMMGNYVWCKTPLTPEAYWSLAERFRPQDYRPEKWLRVAKEAGFGYAVLTTRHHDGYALWPSEYGDFGTRTKLGGRDLVREYVEACRQVGLRVGLYYSVPDWYFRRQYMSFGYDSKGTAESPHLGLRHEPIELPQPPAAFEDEYIAYVNGQITELLTRYGKIDLLWFDGGAGLPLISQERIRELQPEIVINDRAHGKGDFHAGPECVLPKERRQGCWEYCGGLTGCWGYQTRDEQQHPNSVARDLVVTLVKCRAWGGNALLNCGPRPSGEMPDSYYRGLERAQAWMAVCREAVVGVQAGPYPEQSNIPVTVRDKTWYLHLLPGEHPDDPAVLKGDAPIVLKGVEPPRQVVLLGTGQRLESQYERPMLTIAVPRSLRTDLVDVVKIEW